MTLDDQPCPILGRRIPPGFRLREVRLEPGATRAYDEGEWADEIVVIETGELELECATGHKRRFGRGAIMWLTGLPLCSLSNPGQVAAVILAVSRRADEFAIPVQSQAT